MTPEELALLCEARVARAVATSGSLPIVEGVLIGLMMLAIGWMLGFSESQLRAWWDGRRPVAHYPAMRKTVASDVRVSRRDHVSIPRRAGPGPGPALPLCSFGRDRRRGRQRTSRQVDAAPLRGQALRRVNDAPTGMLSSDTCTAMHLRTAPAHGASTRREIPRTRLMSRIGSRSCDGAGSCSLARRQRYAAHPPVHGSTRPRVHGSTLHGGLE